MLGLNFCCFDANLKNAKQACGFNRRVLRTESTMSSEKSKESSLIALNRPRIKRRQIRSTNSVWESFDSSLRFQLSAREKWMKLIWYKCDKRWEGMENGEYLCIENELRLVYKDLERRMFAAASSSLAINLPDSSFTILFYFFIFAVLKALAILVVWVWNPTSQIQGSRKSWTLEPYSENSQRWSYRAPCGGRNWEGKDRSSSNFSSLIQYY